MSRRITAHALAVVLASGAWVGCARPDLVVPSSEPYVGEPPIACKPGDNLPITIDVTLYNKGDAAAVLPAGAHWASVHSAYGGAASTNSDGGPSTLNPGEAIHLQVRTTLRLEMVGTQQIFSWWVVADPDKKIAESVEDNNLDKGPEFKNPGPNYFCSS
jgi:CARDB